MESYVFSSCYKRRPDPMRPCTSYGSTHYFLLHKLRAKLHFFEIASNFDRPLRSTRVQFREPTCQHLSYASNQGHIPKHLMEALKSLSSRAEKRWTHQGNVQFKERTHIHIYYASYPEESSKNPN